MHIRRSHGHSFVAFLTAGSIFLLSPSSAWSWCLGPKSCITDESVCDLGDRSAERLEARGFVDARNPNWKEIVLRRGAGEILSHCKEGQILRLHTSGKLRDSGEVLPEIAKSFCTVASIQRTQNTNTEPLSGETLYGFELKCPISKLEQAKATFAEKEAQTPVETLVSQGNSPSRGGGNQTGSAAQDRTRDCSKISAGALLGLPGPCSGR